MPLGGVLAMYITVTFLKPRLLASESSFRMVFSPGATLRAVVDTILKTRRTHEPECTTFTFVTRICQRVLSTTVA